MDLHVAQATARVVTSGLGALALVGCTVGVQLHVDNPTKLGVAADALDESNGVPVSRIALGSIAAGGHIDPPIFKMKKNHQLVVEATANGFEAWKSSPTTIHSPPDPNLITETVALQAQLLDDAAAVQQINNAFSNIGKTYGLNPLSASNAETSIWGALIVIMPATEKSQANILYEVPPSKFLQVDSSKPADIPKITYPANNNAETVDISGKTAVNMAATFPIIKAGGNFQESSVYQLKWSLLGYGEDRLPTPAGWSLGSAISGLSQTDKSNIATALQNNSGAVLLFVDRVYVLQSGSLSQTEGTTVAAGANLDAGSVITASGAYNFSTANTHTTNFANVVLNIFGDEIAVNMLKGLTAVPVNSSALIASDGGTTPAVTHALPHGKWSFVGAKILGAPPVAIPKSAIAQPH